MNISPRKVGGSLHPLLKKEVLTRCTGGRGVLSTGEGPEYRPFRDLRSVPEAGRPREQVKNEGRACTQVLFVRKAELGFSHFLEIVTGWLVPSTAKDPAC